MKPHFLSPARVMEARELGEKLARLTVEVPSRPRYKLAALMAEIPQGPPRVDGWDDMPSVGLENN
ncbi:hypothetical protein [Herbaspirillum chlorophenolicum]|uniref:hypothetical protein n=1 Tax=Herbaspirillum chlorophenolicum TaxID=211589 RepID=UPI00067D1904|nr:hypothetical protein [Herbaspirillum chlorophenolicum]